MDADCGFGRMTRSDDKNDGTSTEIDNFEIFVNSRSQNDVQGHYRTTRMEGNGVYDVVVLDHDQGLGNVKENESLTMLGWCSNGGLAAKQSLNSNFELYPLIHYAAQPAFHRLQHSLVTACLSQNFH